MSVLSNWVEAYIGLGSNLDNPMNHILSAAQELRALEHVEQIAMSPLYRSRPVGPQNQPDYINAVIRIRTRLTPMDLLKKCQTLENTHGRERLVRWGARTLDVDILLYHDNVIDLSELKIPHPELPNRAFVLYPLADVAPTNLTVPGNGSLASLLAACPANGLYKIEA
ncbi:2-amino-4-hydroxy-6-hydroxymethyldihydropteridine diphosphokinase [Methylomonas sp. MgM2]